MNAHLQLLLGLIPKIDCLLVKYSERLQGLYYSKITSETISEGLVIQNFLGEHAPDPLGGVLARAQPRSNQYVTYLFNNLRTGLLQYCTA